MFTRQQISEHFGGIGPGVLPLKDGKVACGLFDPFSNAVTHLSGEIDVYPRVLPKAAKSLDHDIPAFLKVSTQLWRYVGEYKLAKIEKDKRGLEKAKAELGRDDMAAVLRFQPVKTPLMVVEHKSSKRSTKKH